MDGNRFIVDGKPSFAVSIIIGAVSGGFGFVSVSTAVVGLDVAVVLDVSLDDKLLVDYYPIPLLLQHYHHLMDF